MTAIGLEVGALQRIFAGQGSKAVGLHGVSFDLAPGTFFTLLGPSGCGKTTTLRCVAGLEVPDSGLIMVGDRAFFDSERDINVPLHKRNIGMVFQSYAIWPHMSVAENVAFPLRMAKDHRYTAQEIKTRVNEALDLVGLVHLAGRQPFQLSGGQQQRVALARAMVRQPALLLLDEPLSNLDAVLREEMRGELRRIQQQLGVTTIYVTHDQVEALEMSDLIGVMDNGHLVQMAPPEEVYFHPSNLFVAKFMGASNLVEGKIVGKPDETGLGVVELSDGRKLQTMTSSSVGESVRIYLRPEVLSVTKRGATVHDGNQFEGEVISTSFLGHTRRVRVDIGKAILEVNTDHQNRFPPGEAVTVAFRREDTVALAAGH